ncbi:MAG: hypothetical protein M1453_00450 [Acidobacteria bacterium]|nr:hypothetical protein [Acidobacteriota bacterium]MCL5286457.1 hypothetical protein [Acidobacteriota bacterium]
MKRFATLYALVVFFALSAQSWGAPQYTQRGEIVLAEYGSGNRWTDVSQRVASLARGDVLRFRVDDATLSVNSSPGAQNNLRILVLSPSGEIHWLTFRQNQDVNLRGYTFNVAGFGELRIIRATYGTNVRSNDVTNRLISQIRDGRVSMVVNNSTMGGDPDHDRPKVLTVTYSVDGREDRVSVAEFGHLDLPRDTIDDRYGLRIIHATYGTNVRSNDVTDRLSAQIRDGRISMDVNNRTMGGDPDHDRPKTLTVTYSMDGREDRVSVAEFGHLDLPRDTAAAGYDLRIIRATYGTNVRSNDVTKRVSAQIRDGRISMLVNNSTMGGDPDHDRPKTLNVTYSVDGREDRVSVPEYGQLELPGDSVASRMIPSGTELSIRTNEAIDSRTAREGQRFSAVVEKDVLDNTGALAAPKGSDVELVIRSTEGSELVLDIDSIIVSGRRYNVSTEDLERKGRAGIGANKRTATMVGGGAAIGAVIGAIVGGGKGAAIGAAIGAAGGAGAQVMTKGKDVSVPSETVLSFRLEQDLYLVPQR